MADEPLSEVAVDLVVRSEGLRSDLKKFTSAGEKAGRDFGTAAEKEAAGGGRRAGKRASEEIRQESAKGFGNAGKSAARAFAGAAVITGGVMFAKQSIDAASNLQETTTKLGAIFDDVGEAAVLNFAKKGPEALGLSQQAAMDAAATFSIFGKGAGLTGKALADFSTDLTSLSVDLASFHNASPEEAITAIGAALRGETEPIRRFGVMLDDASMREQAFAMGITKSTKDALLPNQKALAAQALIMKQTADAQGDFARTSDGLANQQRILTAKVEDAKAAIGQELLPTVLQVVEVFSKQGVPIVESLGKSFAAIVTASAPLVPVLSKTLDAFTRLSPPMQTTLVIAGGLAKMGMLAPLWRAFATVMGLTATNATAATASLTTTATAEAAVGTAASVAAPRVGLLAASMKALNGVVAVAGVATLAVQLGEADAMSRNVKVGVEDLTKGLEQAGIQSEKFTEIWRNKPGLLFGGDEAGKAVNFADAMDRLADATENAFGDSLDAKLGRVQSFGDDVAIFKDKMLETDQALAAMVANGNAEAAKKEYETLVAVMKNSGASDPEIASVFEGYIKAAKESEIATVSGSSAATGASAAWAVFGSQVEKVTSQVAAATPVESEQRQMRQNYTAATRAAKDAQLELSTAILAVTNAELGAANSDIAWATSLATTEAAIRKTGKSTRDHGAAINLSTEAGRANATALTGMSSAYIKSMQDAAKNGEGVKALTARQKEGRAAFLAAADAAGLNTEAANALADKYGFAKDQVGAYIREAGKTPKKVVTEVEVKTTDALWRLEKIQQRLANLPETKFVNIVATVKGDTAGRELIRPGYNAEGTNYWEGGWTWVGEKGPELMQLPKGSKILSNAASMGMVKTATSAAAATVSKITAGVEKSSRAVTAAVKKVATSAVKAVIDTKGEFYNAGKNVPKAISEGIEGGRDGISKALADIYKKLADAHEWNAARLTHGATSATAYSLMTLGSSLDSINERLDKARALYESRLDQMADYSAGVSKSLVQSVFEEKGVRGPSAGGIVKRLEEQKRKAEEFGKALATLRTMGLNATSFEQIASGGPDALAGAQALIAGGKASVATVNRLQRGINAASATAGKTASETLYLAGVRSAEGIVKGLEKQRSRVEAELGRLGRRLGEQIAAAITKSVGGLTAVQVKKVAKKKYASGTLSSAEGWALTGERGPELLRLPGGTRVYPAGATSRMLNGGGTTIYNVTFSIDDLERIGTVAEFVDMLQSARAQARQTRRSGRVSA